MSESGLSPAITTAIIGGAVSVFILAINSILNSRRDRVTRQRQEFSKAFAACVAYEEFVYIVRRRRSDAPQEERVRISSELSNVQRELGYYSAWLATESSDVSKAYEKMVAKLREIAGAQIREGWLSPPIHSDEKMNMPDLGLDALKPLKEAYLSKVAEHLSWIPKPVRYIVKLLRVKNRSQYLISSQEQISRL